MKDGSGTCTINRRKIVLDYSETMRQEASMHANNHLSQSKCDNENAPLSQGSEFLLNEDAGIRIVLNSRTPLMTQPFCNENFYLSEDNQSESKTNHMPPLSQPTVTHDDRTLADNIQSR